VPAQTDDLQYDTGLARVYRAAHRAGWSREAYECLLDAEGIDRAVLFPTRGLGLTGTHVRRSLMCSAVGIYTDRAWRFVHASRLAGVGLLPREHPDLGPAFVRLARTAEFACVVMRPNPVGLSPALDSEAYEDTWACAAELGMPVVFHEGTGAARFLGRSRGRTYLERHAMSHPFEMMAASMQLMLGGVFERHPRLRVGFFEAGAGWAPYWLERLDGHVTGILGRDYALPALPSEYFRRQCAVTLDAGEAAPDGLRSLFASDLPHGDSSFPHSRRLTSRANPGRPDVMGGWAEEFFACYETHGGPPFDGSTRPPTTATPSPASCSTPSPGETGLEASA
jgi:predicted TIM-barrel fold metal-dependent hydrolase